MRKYWTEFMALLKLKLYEINLFESEFDLVKKLLVTARGNHKRQIRSSYSKEMLWMFPCALHIKWSFLLEISSANVTKSAVSSELVIFTEKTLNGKLHFFNTKTWLTHFAPVFQTFSNISIILLCSLQQ